MVLRAETGKSCIKAPCWRPIQQRCLNESQRLTELFLTASKSYLPILLRGNTESSILPCAGCACSKITVPQRKNRQPPTASKRIRQSSEQKQGESPVRERILVFGRR